MRNSSILDSDRNFGPPRDYFPYASLGTSRQLTRKRIKGGFFYSPVNFFYSSSSSSLLLPRRSVRSTSLTDSLSKLATRIESAEAIATMEKIIYRQGDDGPRGILETLHLPILREKSLRAAINTLCSLLPPPPFSFFIPRHQDKVFPRAR